MLRTIDLPDERDLAAVGRRGVEHLLHPVHVTREARHDDTLLRGREHVGQHGRDRPLAGHDPRHLGVGGVGHEQVDAVAAQPRESREVGQPAVEWQLVHFEIAGVQHQPGGRADRDGERIGDGMVDREEFKIEAPERLPGTLRHSNGDRIDAVLGQLARHQRKREPRPDEGDVFFFPAAGTAPLRCDPRARA